MEAGTNRAEAETALAMAEKLLVARDLVGSKRFALQAQDLDPLLDGIDQILTITEVLLASEKRIGNYMDWYAILQLDSSSDDLQNMKRQYRRLALLLHPDKNKSVGADNAFKLVCDAWNLLSDLSKKALYDKQLNSITNKESKEENQKQKTKNKKGNLDDGHGNTESNFWTTCPFCCNIYEYDKDYENCTLRCQNCKRAFYASAIQSLPPLVPGMDAYYSAWGFFPLGIPGQNPYLGFGFGGRPSGPDLGNDRNMGFSSWRHSFPMFGGSAQSAEKVSVDHQNVSMNFPDQNGVLAAEDIKSKTKSKSSASKNKKKTPAVKVKKAIQKKTSAEGKNTGALNTKAAVQGSHEKLVQPQKKCKLTKKNAKKPTASKHNAKKLAQVVKQASENSVPNSEMSENTATPNAVADETQNAFNDPVIGEKIDHGTGARNTTEDIDSSMGFEDCQVASDGVGQVESSQLHGDTHVPDMNDILNSISKFYSIKDKELKWI